jgi:hypothetical protein
MRLTDEELRDVLERAEEIQRASRHGEEMHAELEAVIGAAEEVGLTRSAVERALRERLDLFAPPAIGSLVFAKSADDKFHVAETLSVSPEEVRVRFLRGTEHVVASDEVKRCTFIPGQRVTCHWPWWGPWTCTVLAYDAPSQFLKLSDGWGSTTTKHIADVWLEPARKPNDGAVRKRVSVTLLGAGAGVGALLGSLITALLMR